MSGSLGAVIYGELRALAAQVATSIANIAAARAEATANRDSINSNTNTARDNINAGTNAARDNVKNHVTASLGGLALNSVKSVQNINGTGGWVNGNGGWGGSSYVDVAINAVNTNKAMLTPIIQFLPGSSNYPMLYRFISANVVRVELVGITAGGTVRYIFSVVEFN